MPLSIVEIEEIQAKRNKKREELCNLLSTPFDMQNPEQLSKLKEYIDDFELSVHQMQLFQAANIGLKSLGSIWLAGHIYPYLPVSIFFGPLFYLLTSLCVTGCILKQFNTDNFYHDLNDMKRLYLWALKNGNGETDPNAVIGGVQFHNTDLKLANVHIQRMIKLIAPSCKTDFIVAWPTKANQKEQNKGWSSWFSVSMFPTTKPNINQSYIDEFKTCIESRRFDLCISQGAQQAIQYFATDTRFRELLTSKVRDEMQKLNPMSWLVATNPGLKIN